MSTYIGFLHPKIDTKCPFKFLKIRQTDAPTGTYFKSKLAQLMTYNTGKFQINQQKCVTLTSTNIRRP